MVVRQKALCKSRNSSSLFIPYKKRNFSSLYKPFKNRNSSSLSEQFKNRNSSSLYEPFKNHNSSSLHILCKNHNSSSLHSVMNPSWYFSAPIILDETFAGLRKNTLRNSKVIPFLTALGTLWMLHWFQLQTFKHKSYSPSSVIFLFGLFLLGQEC